MSTLVEGQCEGGGTAALPLTADGSAVKVDVTAEVDVDTSLLATSANQTDGTQKSQRVDGSGNVAPAGDTVARASFVKVTNGTQTMPTGDAATRPVFVELSDGSAAVAVATAANQATIIAALTLLKYPNTITAITPSDITDVTATCAKGILVTVAGVVNVTGVGGSAAGLGTLPAGTHVAIALSRVNAATTATVVGLSGP